MYDDISIKPGTQPVDYFMSLLKPSRFSRSLKLTQKMTSTSSGVIFS
jgi:hypothetical protein